MTHQEKYFFFTHSTVRSLFQKDTVTIQSITGEDLSQIYSEKIRDVSNFLIDTIQQNVSLFAQNKKWHRYK